VAHSSASNQGIDQGYTPRQQKNRNGTAPALHRHSCLRATGSSCQRNNNSITIQLYAGSSCGLFDEAINPSSGEIGCTDFNGDLPQSVRVVSGPADGCAFSLYSDGSCNSRVAIVDSSNWTRKCGTAFALVAELSSFSERLLGWQPGVPSLQSGVLLMEWSFGIRLFVTWTAP